jgi:hypothetical protein
LATIVSACSLITSLDGLSDDTNLRTGDASTDRATPASDGGNPAAPDGDAPIQFDDAPSPDGVADADAGADALPDTASPLYYCSGLSPSPLFCDDFDQSANLVRWDSTGAAHGSVTISSVTTHSPPNAVESTSTPVTSGQTVDVGLYKAFPTLVGLPRLETLSFDLYLETMDATHNALAVVGGLALRNAVNALHELQFVVTLSGGKVVATFPEYSEPGDGGATGFINHGVTAQLALRTWTRITIELTLGNPSGGAGNQARLLFDGVAVATIAINLTAKDPAPQLVLGLSYVSPPSDAWTVRYDNVTFDSKP